jgi:hypothetical protein
MGAVRREHDAYYTPDGATRELVRRRPDIGRPGEIVIEPCCGARAIANVFAERGAHVVTNDLVPSIEADVHGDAGDRAHWKTIEDYVDGLATAIRRPVGSTFPIDWVITNPPFLTAFDILRRSYERAGKGVAMFLRLSFLEPTEDRGPWLAITPPDELIVLPRISFTGDGATDSVTCAWMLWYKHKPRVLRGETSQGWPIEIVPKPEAVDDGQVNLWGV